MTCRGHAAQLGRIYPELKSRDTDVLLIGGGNVAAAAGLARALKLPFPVLADPDRAVYASFGLDKMLFIQRSATVLIDKKKTIRYILRATNPRSSFDKDELLKAISTL
jgi:peroxiredoxin